MHRRRPPFARSLALAAPCALLGLLPAQDSRDTRSTTIIVAAANAHPASRQAANFVCSGIADETTLAAAVAELPTVGGTIQLTEGSFELRGGLRIGRSHVTLRGQGSATLVTRPERRRGATLTIRSADGDVTGTRIEAMRFERGGRTAGTFAIRANGARDLRIEGCTFSNLYGAIDLDDVDGAMLSGNTLREVATGFWARGTSGLRIDGNHADDISRGPGLSTSCFLIAVGRPDSNLLAEKDIGITNNTITNSNSTGISLRALSQTGAPGSLRGVTISGNRLSNLGTGVQILENNGTTLISTNTILDCSKGIDVARNGTAILRGNHVSGCAEGIFIGRNGTARATGVQVCDNTIEHNNIGLAMENTLRPRITGNVFRSNNRSGASGFGILAQATAEEMLIENNQFHDNVGNGGASYNILITPKAGGTAPIIRNNVFYGSGLPNERGALLAASIPELYIMTGNVFHGFASTGHAIGSQQAQGLYAGTCIFDGTSWTKL